MKIWGSKRIVCFVLASIISFSVFAQEEDDDLEFEEFPDLELPVEDTTSNELDDSPSEATSPSTGATSNQTSVPPGQATDDEEAAQASGQPKNNVLKMDTTGASTETTEITDEDLKSLDDEVVPVSPVPDQLKVTAPETASSLDDSPTNLGDFGAPSESLFNNETQYPDDIKALESRLQDAESSYGDQRRREEGLVEPGDDLPPPEQFSRVPLGPPMSDANWVRWAGPMATKEYKIRKGDSLWAVSERLFGNPYLWPKIWHLNASVTNPHIIERGMVLSFNPGNPNSAPELAYRPTQNDLRGIGLHPLTSLDKQKTLLEIIDDNLRRQIGAPHPPFQFFLLDSKPKVLAEIPSVPNRSGRRFWVEGDSFRTKLGDGIFPIIRSEHVLEKSTSAYRIRWIGLLEVQNQKATVNKSFVELREGDEVVQRRFTLSPLAVHNDNIGPLYREETHLVAIQEGASYQGGEGQMMGIRFPAIGLGPRPGAILEIQVGHNRKSKALLVDRDQRMGTLWILEGDQEVSVTDKIY